LIAIATKEDLPRIVELVKLGVEEIKCPYETSMATLADSIYRSYMVAPQFIVKVKGEIVGVASLTLSTYPWSQKPYLTSNMVYVLQNHRSYSIIKELYNAIKNYARLQGVLYVDNFIGTNNIDARLRGVKSQGLEITGISIKYEV